MLPDPDGTRDPPRDPPARTPGTLLVVEAEKSNTRIAAGRLTPPDGPPASDVPPPYPVFARDPPARTSGTLLAVEPETSDDRIAAGILSRYPPDGPPESDARPPCPVVAEVGRTISSASRTGLAGRGEHKSIAAASVRLAAIVGV